MGSPLVAGTIAIVTLAGSRLVPERTLRTMPPDFSAHARTLVEHYRLAPREQALLGRRHGIAEVMIPPRSDLIGRPVFPGMTTDSGELVVVAVHREGEDAEDETALRAGDAMLLQGSWAALDEQLEDPGVVVVDAPDAVRRQAVPLGTGARRALAVLAAMVAALATGAIPAAVAGLLAATALVVLGVLTPEQCCGRAGRVAASAAGQAANGAQYGIAGVHFYWIGAVPAMVFLGLVMMPFYYGSRVRSVPEYLRLRFGKAAHLFNAIAFSIATVLIAGVNLYALALVLQLLLGWPIIVGIVVAAGIVLTYITLGGLSSAIYNEVLQFFVIIAAMLPVTIIGLHDVGGWDGLKDAISQSKLGPEATHSWEGLSVSNPTNPIGASWIAIVFGLGFVQSFNYWTTNFAEVQRALSARNLSAARRTPLIGAFPKLLLGPIITIIPGMIAAVTIQGLGGSNETLQYNNAIPLLMREYLPNGMLGIGLAGLMAAFMAGVAANVSAFNTVITTDLWEPYVRPGREDAYYLRFGRIATVAGIVVSIATALVASGYTNIMNYIQVLFSIFNVPLFATFIIGMFWKRTSPAAGFWGMVAGSIGALGTYLLYKADVIGFGSDLAEAFWGAIVAFVLDAIVTVGVTLVTKSKPVEELDGLVYGMAVAEDENADPADDVWYRNPKLLGFSALGLTVGISLFFI